MANRKGEIMEIKLSITSEQKANPFYERTLCPVEDDKNFKVKIVPLKSLENTRYAMGTGVSGFDIESILRDHVVGIEGLELMYADGKKHKVTKIDELLDLPMSIELDTLLMKIFNAIYTDGKLTEDEEKN